MACGSRSAWQIISAWTNGDTTTVVFHPVVRVDPSRVSGVKMSFAMYGRLANSQFKRAYRGSNDGGVTWSAVTEYGSYASAEDTWYEGASASTPDVAYGVVEYGITGVNVAGTARGSCLLHLRIDQISQ